MKLKSVALVILLLGSATESHAETWGYLVRKPGDDGFYVDKKHKNGVEAIRKNEWTRALVELESCLNFYLESAREGSLYRDSSKSSTPPDSIVMYDPRYNSVRYSLAVASAHAAAMALDEGNTQRGDSLSVRSNYFLQHVKGGDGPDMVEALCHLAKSNMASGRLRDAESMARKAVNTADRGLTENDPIRGFAYLRLGEIYLAAGKAYDADAPLMIAIDVADTGAARKDEHQTLSREMAVEARCLLAKTYALTEQRAECDSLFWAALALVESAKKPINVPQTDSLFGQFVQSLESTDPESAAAVHERISNERERRQKEYAKK